MGSLKGYPEGKGRGAFYGWWMVAISGFIMVITSVPVFMASAVWAVALESHFGWSRTQLGLALSFTRIEGSLTGPVAGYLVDRFGTRFMVFSGLLILTGGFFLFSRIENLWMFYLAYFIMSVGQGQAGKRNAVQTVISTALSLGARADDRREQIFQRPGFLGEALVD